MALAMALATMRMRGSGRGKGEMVEGKEGHDGRVTARKEEADTL